MLQFMKVLYDCGSITNESIEQLKVNYSIVDDLLRKEQLIAKRKGNTVFYFLTEYGEKVYRINTDKTIFFRCSNLEKVSTLVDFYSKLSIEERNTWKSKDVWYSEGIIGPIPDATYLKDNKLVAVYVQTENTTKNIISDVETFIKEKNIENISYIK